MKDGDSPLDEFFPYRLAVAAEGFSRALAEVYGRRFGLSREEWRLLFLLSGGEAITSLELGRRTTLDKVQISRASQRLEDKGLITREVAPSDRRLRLYATTEKGARLFREIQPHVETRASEILGTISRSDRAALERGLLALREAVSSSKSDGAD